MAKRQLIKTLFLGMITCVFFVFLVACTDKSEPTLSVDKHELNMSVGENVQLTATLNGTEERVDWNSSDPQTVLLSVSEDDKIVTVEALKVGHAVISASIGSLSEKCVVTVNETLSSLSLTYGGLEAISFQVNDVLDPSYIKVIGGVEGLDYHFTLINNNQEIVLEQVYTFETAGEYILKAEVITEGYRGNAQMRFNVNEWSPDEIEAVLKYDGVSEPIRDYIGYTLDYEKLSVESKIIEENELIFVWTLLDGEGNEKEILDSGYTFTEAGEYRIGLRIEDNAYICTSILSVTIQPLSDIHVTLLYGGEPADEVEWLWGSNPKEFSVQALPQGINGQWSVLNKNGESFELDRIEELTPGLYMVKYSIVTYGYKGEATCSVTVYRDHSQNIELQLDTLLWTGKEYDFSPSVDGETLDFTIQIQYGNENLWERFSGQFEHSGKIKLKVGINDETGIERGTKDLEVSVYNVGSEYVFNAGIKNMMLVTGVTATVQGKKGIYGNDQSISLETNATENYSLFVEMDSVAKTENNKIVAQSAGSTKIYAKIGFDLYEILNVTVRELTGYKAITSIEDWNALPAGNSSENYVLTSDLDFKNQVVAKKFGRVNYKDTDGLAGVLDGNGHAIMNYTAPSGASQALIGQVAQTGVVRNVRFLGVVGNTTVGGYYGCVIGFLLGTAEDLYAEIKIQTGSTADKPDSAKCVGGLIGQGRGWNWSLNRCIVVLDKETPDDLKYTGALVGGIEKSSNPYYIHSGYVVGLSKIPVVAVTGNTLAPENFVNGSTPIENQGRYAKFSSISEMKEFENEHASGRFSEGGLFDRAFWNLVWETIAA